MFEIEENRINLFKSANKNNTSTYDVLIELCLMSCEEKNILYLSDSNLSNKYRYINTLNFKEFDKNVSNFIEIIKKNLFKIDWIVLDIEDLNKELIEYLISLEKTLIINVDNYYFQFEKHFNDKIFFIFETDSDKKGAMNSKVYSFMSHVVDINNYYVSKLSHNTKFSLTGWMKSKNLDNKLKKIE